MPVFYTSDGSDNLDKSSRWTERYAESKHAAAYAHIDEKGHLQTQLLNKQAVVVHVARNARPKPLQTFSGIVFLL